MSYSALFARMAWTNQNRTTGKKCVTNSTDVDGATIIAREATNLINFQMKNKDGSHSCPTAGKTRKKRNLKSNRCWPGASNHEIKVSHVAQHTTGLYDHDSLSAVQFIHLGQLSSITRVFISFYQYQLLDNVLICHLELERSSSNWEHTNSL